MWPIPLTLKAALTDHGRILHMHLTQAMEFYCGDLVEDKQEGLVGMLGRDFDDAVFQMWVRTQERYPRIDNTLPGLIAITSVAAAAKFINRHSGMQIKLLLNNRGALHTAYYYATSRMVKRSPGLPNLESSYRMLLDWQCDPSQNSVVSDITGCGV